MIYNVLWQINDYQIMSSNFKFDLDFDLYIYATRYI